MGKTVEQAKARLKEQFFKPEWPDTTLVISHSKRMAVNAVANRALAPEALLLLKHPHRFDLGNCAPKQQSMRVWPELRLMRAGGKIPKDVFVAVAEVEPDGVRLDNAEEPAAAGHPAKPRSDANLESCHLTLRHQAPQGRQAPSCWRRPSRTDSTTPPGGPA